MVFDRYDIANVAKKSLPTSINSDNFMFIQNIITPNIGRAKRLWIGDCLSVTKRGWRRMLPTSIDFVNGEIINKMPQI